MDHAGQFHEDLMSTSCECGTENKTILRSLNALMGEVREIRLGDIAEIKTTLVIVKDKVDRVHKTVHEGNGQPPLIARVQALETNRDNSSKFSLTKVTMWGMIVTALIAAFAGIVVALIK